ncbi:MAG: hypothetical protein LWX00_06260 [Spirochaetia bacterium]|nr:hypothetical protein [Spirochaetia bacterium]
MKPGPLLYVARRWGYSSRKQASVRRSILASAGIAAGVAALIVVVSIMGGLQQGYIDAILEISSFHVRVELSSETDPIIASEKIQHIAGVVSVLPFQETTMLAVGPGRKTANILVRAVPDDALARDPAMARALNFKSSVNHLADNKIYMGSEAGFLLGIGEGDSLELLNIVSDEQSGIMPFSAELHAGPMFRSGYYEFDSGMAFISSNSVPAASMKGKHWVLGIKLNQKYRDFESKNRIAAILGSDSVSIQTWREYNRSFFGALRTEKTVMMLLVGVIFLVVGMNIFHSMRRTIASKMQDIAVMKSFGVSGRDLNSIFIMDGFEIGIFGALAGFAAGMILARKINEIILFFLNLAAQLAVLFQGLGFKINQYTYQRLTASYFYLDKIPVSITEFEIFFIIISAVASSVFAAVLASRKTALARPSEVFRNE